MGVKGGALSVDKSWWYLIEYVWRMGKWMANDDVAKLDLLATSSRGGRISLKRLQAYEASSVWGMGGT